MEPASITTPEATPNLSLDSIVFTTGSSIHINAPASKVWDVITKTKTYAEWNTWTPTFEFMNEEGEPGEMALWRHGHLTAKMEGQGKEYKVPVEVIEFSDPNASGDYVLACRASLLPSWFATAERMHIITPSSDEKGCEVRQCESMAGWGAYLLKWLLAVEKELREVNLKYTKELKARVEQL